MKEMDIPLARKLVTTLIKKGAQMTDAISEVVKKEGLTIQQFNVLRILRGRHGEGATLQDISSQMIHSNSNTTRVIDKLIAKKYVERMQCKVDRRQIQVTITGNGMKVLKSLDEIINQREYDLIKNLESRQVKIVLDFLSKI